MALIGAAYPLRPALYLQVNTVTANGKDVGVLVRSHVHVAWHGMCLGR